jgi:hypothetical protein
MFRMFFIALLSPVLAVAATSWKNLEPFDQWSMDKAVKVLNDSPWAKQQTFTRVIRGVGSGISGEKEIYNTFYVRFLSARPIREAYARVKQIQHGYDTMSPEEKLRFEEALSPGLDLDVSKWIVLTVSFRSNDPNEESRVRRFFQSETVETLKTKAFLSTPTCPQVEIFAYFPQKEESVGAKLVFPREYDGLPVITKECSSVTLELLDVPGTESESSFDSRSSSSESRFRTTFKVESMIVGDRIII